MSTCTASSAARSGLCARLLSYVSRRSRSAAVRCVSGAVLPGAAGGPHVRRGGEEDLQRRPRGDDRADVPALDHDLAVADELRCCATSSARTPGAAETGLTAAVTARDRISPSTGWPSTVTCWWSGSVVTVIHGPGGEIGHRGRVLRVDALAQDGPGHRPVHRAGVEVAEAEPTGEPAGDGRLRRYPTDRPRRSRHARRPAPAPTTRRHCAHSRVLVHPRHVLLLYPRLSNQACLLLGSHFLHTEVYVPATAGVRRVGHPPHHPDLQPGSPLRTTTVAPTPVPVRPLCICIRP